MEISEISKRLADRAADVAAMLLPGGRLIGREWCAGDVYGGKGESLKVAIAGEKAGRWADFANQPNDQGDLIDLWAKSKGITVAAALVEARAYLGIEEPRFAKRQERTYTRPKPPKGAIAPAKGTPVDEYLRLERGIAPEIIKLFKVAQAPVFHYTTKEGNAGELAGPWICFPFLRPNTEGRLELVNVKWRHVQNRPDGKKRLAQEKDAQPTLFGWQAIPDEARGVLICEGEIDAMTWSQWGWHALSVPAGAGGGHKQDWIEHDWPLLERFDEILLAFDTDPEGQQAVPEIARRLGLHRCRNVLLPHKDANECLVKHGMTREEIKPFVDKAQIMSPAQLRNAAEYADKVTAIFFPPEKEEDGTSTPWSRAKVRLRSGEWTLVTGINGHGKSMLVTQQALHSMDEGRKSCWGSFEIPAEQTLSRTVKQGCRSDVPDRQMIQDWHSWLGERLWIIDVVGSITPDDLFATMLYARRRFGCWLFVVDSLMRCGIRVDDYEAQGLFAKRISDFVIAEACHVMLIAHSRKPKDESKPVGKLDVKGSGDISDNAFMAWSVYRNKVKETALAKIEDDPVTNAMVKWKDSSKHDWKEDAVLTIDKVRNDRDREGRIRLWYNQTQLCYRDERGGVARLLRTFRIRPEETQPSLYEGDRWPDDSTL